MSAALHFVISAPRSGSTWLARSLNEHPEVFATEHRLFGNFCEVWRTNDGTSAPRITFDNYARAFAMHYFYDQMDMNHGQFVDVFQKSFINFVTQFGSRRSGKPIVIDKITPYPGTAELVTRQIRKICPDAKIVQLIRDGRDVLTSGTFDWLLKDAEGTDRHRFFEVKEPGFVLKRFFDDAVITKWAENWRETIDAFKTRQADAQIRYEAMKTDQAAELSKIFKILGANPDSEIANACAQATTFKKTTGRSAGDAVATAKARKGVAGDWKNYLTRADGQLFHQLAGQQLIELGYESDAGWLDDLPTELNLQQV